MPLLLGSPVAGDTASSCKPILEVPMFRRDFTPSLSLRIWGPMSPMVIERKILTFQGLPSEALAPLPDLRDSVWASAGSQPAHEPGQAHHWIPLTSWQPGNPVECLWLGTQKYHIHLDFHSLCTAAYKKCGWAHFWAWGTALLVLPHPLLFSGGGNLPVFPSLPRYRPCFGLAGLCPFSKAQPPFPLRDSFWPWV